APGLCQRVFGFKSACSSSSSGSTKKLCAAATSGQPHASISGVVTAQVGKGTSEIYRHIASETFRLLLVAVCCCCCCRTKFLCSSNKDAMLRCRILHYSTDVRSVRLEFSNYRGKYFKYPTGSEALLFDFARLDLDHFIQ